MAAADWQVVQGDADLGACRIGGAPVAGQVVPGARALQSFPFLLNCSTLEEFFERSPGQSGSS